MYLSDIKKLIPFVPEIQIKEKHVDEETYNKYFIQRDIDYNKLRITNIGEYSISVPYISLLVSKKIGSICGKSATITDALANVGGMTIRFAEYFNKINACEIVPIHSQILRNNLDVYGYSSKVHIYTGDYLGIAKKIKQDVIFFDPPWGGDEYKLKEKLSLGLNNLNIIHIINQLEPYTKWVFLLAPHNYNVDDLLYCKYKYSIFHLTPKSPKSKLLICFTLKEH